MKRGSAATKRPAGTTREGNMAAERFKAILLAGAAAEDRGIYSAEALDAAATMAYAALCRQRKGHAHITIDQDDALIRDDKPVSAITVINDNMPFLFDSLLGEINETAGEPLLVVHPVLEVSHDDRGVCEIHGVAERPNPPDGINRVSVVHIHVARLDKEEARQLRGRLEEILKQVRHAVSDWRDMLIRLDHAISIYRHGQQKLDHEATEEAAEFLEWLRDDNFTFLGMREYAWSGNSKSGELTRKAERGLGILHDPELRVLRRGGEAVTTTPQIREFMASSDPLIVTKANIKSVIHRRAYLDYIGVKTFDRKGQLLGELRILGLFTSTAYTRSVLKIPFLRAKVEKVIDDLHYDREGHSGRALINILETYPRDELFQIDAETLKRNAAAVAALFERPRLRVLPRPEKFGRYVSVLVYVPRDRYDSHVREKIGAYLARVYEGRVSAYYPEFPEGSLARVHFIIGRDGTEPPKVDQARLEADVRALVRTWDDGLKDAALEADASHVLTRIAARFTQDYRAVTEPGRALSDAAIIARLSDGEPTAVSFYRDETHQLPESALKIFNRGEPVALSSRVPVLENMGFHVIAERTFEVPDDDGATVFIHDMEISSKAGREIELGDDGAKFESLFIDVSRGAIDNDGYNGLAHSAGLSGSEITIMRSYGRYLQQAGITHSQGFVAGVLNRHPEIARAVYKLFVARFDPSARASAETVETEIKATLTAALDAVPSLDDDTVLRRFVTLIDATERTNRYAPVMEGVPPRSLAFKLRPRDIPFLPAPRPMHEIFVYGPEVEGVHLRFGPVARGGLRWSDRPLDYRTEVLGLVKAQQVKNAVIVPVGAKGGFYPKKLPAGGRREEIFEAGKQAYVNFVSSLLSVTDNLDGDKVIGPKGVIRHDGNDPYFVVAADKGTATFSDTANAISQDYGFWLDDAFASGGSAGYDHKKMGITARGAWEAVKRHFREMNRDIQSEPFSVIGVGDMSGDVFGNGMLLSPCIRLIAAFDHRDIFIDPDPDSTVSFAERKRLFDMGRSSWQDYDTSKISKGGGVYSRAQKSIKLSKAAAETIGLEGTTASPFDIMTAILKSRADLLWFGGIGTYVRASSESNADAGDRANDAIRITAAELNARVVGEGANLGMTQRARIEYGLKGGRCNSDAIDNSAGVNSSDVEVNIKIALASAMRSGELKRAARDKLLEKMTVEVAALVLETNYDQTLAISLSQARGMTETAHDARLMENLEARGLLDRKVELLPDEKALSERQARGEALTRAEIGVLLSYAKIVTFGDILATDLPDEPHFEADLLAYFPAEMVKDWKAHILTHRLRREIIATELANDAINRGGPAFISRQLDLSGRSPGDVVRAYAVVRDGYELPALYAQIDALDTMIPGAAQLELYSRVSGLIHNATAWYLKNGDLDEPVDHAVAALRAARRELEPNISSLLPRFMKEKLAERASHLKSLGAPVDLAKTLALLGASELIPDIAKVARDAGAAVGTAASLFFDVTEFFRLGRIEETQQAIATTDYYDGLALSRANDMINAARQGIAVTALTRHGDDAAPFKRWIEGNTARIDRARGRIQTLLESGDLTVSRLTVAAGLMEDLAGV
ncbi:MAG: NAD-glutamate dehydrogenase [Notoacmeibacter sp.]|nr:NAD-glutamate dehydrogenase [Notoacmeibacter sp.]